MITNFKIFENDDNPYYYVGDIVECVYGTEGVVEAPKDGKKYLVLRIYEVIYNIEGESTITDYKYVTEKDIYNFDVDIKDIETGKVLVQWSSYRFISEIRTTTNKFNI